MESLIQVFRMNEVTVKTRIRIIKALGQAINDQLGGNYSEGLVYELVLALDPNDDIINNDYYKKHVIK